MLSQKEIISSRNITREQEIFNTNRDSQYASTMQSNFKSLEFTERIRAPTFGSIVRRFKHHEHAISQRMISKSDLITDRSSQKHVTAMNIRSSFEKMPTLQVEDDIFSNQAIKKAQPRKKRKPKQKILLEKLNHTQSSLKHQSYFRSNLNTDGLSSDKVSLRILAQRLNSMPNLPQQRIPERQSKLTDNQGYRTQWLLKQVKTEASASPLKQKSKIEECMTLVPTQKLSKILNGQTLLKFSLPDSEHNKRLIQNNIYRFGSEVVNKHERIPIKQNLRDAGYQVPLTQQDRMKIVGDFNQKSDNKKSGFQNRDLRVFQQYEKELESYRFSHIERQVSNMVANNTVSADKMKQSNTSSFYSNFVDNMKEKQEKLRTIQTQMISNDLSFNQFQTIPQQQKVKDQSYQNGVESKMDAYFVQERAKSLTYNYSQERITNIGSMIEQNNKSSTSREREKGLANQQSFSISEQKSGEFEPESNHDQKSESSENQSKQQTMVDIKQQEQESQFKKLFQVKVLGQIRSILQNQYGLFKKTKTRKIVSEKKQKSSNEQTNTNKLVSKISSGFLQNRKTTSFSVDSHQIDQQVEEEVQSQSEQQEFIESDHQSPHNLYELSTQECVNINSIESKIKAFKPESKLTTAVQAVTGFNSTVELAKQLQQTAQANQTSMALQQKTKARPNEIGALTLNDLKFKKKEFEAESHFIDASLRQITSSKMLQMHQLEELVRLRDTFKSFDDQSVDVSLLKSDSILRQFWEEHNRTFNQGLDQRKKQEKQMPFRSVYIDFLKKLLSTSDSEIGRILIKRFENPDKFVMQQENQRERRHSIKL